MASQDYFPSFHSHSFILIWHLILFLLGFKSFFFYHPCDCGHHPPGSHSFRGLIPIIIHSLKGLVPVIALLVQPFFFLIPINVFGFIITAAIFVRLNFACFWSKLYFKLHTNTVWLMDSVDVLTILFKCLGVFVVLILLDVWFPSLPS